MVLDLICAKEAHVSRVVGTFVHFWNRCRIVGCRELLGFAFRKMDDMTFQDWRNWSIEIGGKAHPQQM